MNKQELNVLVRGVAQRFEKETGISITARALDALVIPALPHLETVTRELDEGKITVPFLEGSVRTVLLNARAVALEQGEDAITFYEVRESMKKECPYSFWC
jgi:hypothetical protein